MLDSQDARTIAEEYENILFTSLIDKKKNKIIKRWKMCVKKYKRATDEYHIQAVERHLFYRGSFFKF